MPNLPYVDSGHYLFRFLDHRTNHFWNSISDLLAEQKLFLNSRIHFNDPYDSQPDVCDDLTASAIRSYAREMIQNPWHPDRDAATTANILELKARGKTRLNNAAISNIKTGMRRNASQYLDECGLLSFTLSATHPLLWAHYAAGGAGVCVVFRRGTSMQSGLCLCTKITYTAHRPKLPISLYYKLVREQRSGAPFENIANEIISLSFLHKSKEWEYEQEARIFYPFHALKKICFDPDELIAVVFGPKAPSDLKERLATEIARLAPWVSTHEATLSPNGFGILLPRLLAQMGIIAA
jgi:hypothetical protein